MQESEGNLGSKIATDFDGITADAALADVIACFSAMKLDLAEAATVVIGVQLEKQFSRDRLWGHVVINLYTGLLATLSEEERTTAMRFVDRETGAGRLQHMVLLIEAFPPLAGDLLRSLATAVPAMLASLAEEAKLQPPSDETIQVIAARLKLVAFDIDVARAPAARAGMKWAEKLVAQVAQEYGE